MKAPFSTISPSDQETVGAASNTFSPPDIFPENSTPEDPDTPATNTERGILVILCVLVAGTFAMDLYTTLGIADGVFYVKDNIMTP